MTNVVCEQESCHQSGRIVQRNQQTNQLLEPVTCPDCLRDANLHSGATLAEQQESERKFAVGHCDAEARRQGLLVFGFFLLGLACN